MDRGGEIGCPKVVAGSRGPISSSLAECDSWDSCMLSGMLGTAGMSSSFGSAVMYRGWRTRGFAGRPIGAELFEVGPAPTLFVGEYLLVISGSAVWLLWMGSRYMDMEFSMSSVFDRSWDTGRKARSPG